MEDKKRPITETLEYIDKMFDKGKAVDFNEEQWETVRAIVMAACGHFIDQ